MANYARIENGQVMEVVVANDLGELGTKYHANIVAQLVLDNAGTAVQGWTYDGVNFAAPAAPAVATVAQIKAEANRRIQASGHDWMAAREVGGGAVMPANIKTFAAAIRADSLALETTPVVDYTNNTHWTVAP